MRLKTLAFTFFFCATVTLANDVAFACTCIPTTSALAGFEGSEVVMLGRVISLNKENLTESAFSRTHSATVIVEKVYKGNAQPRDELLFAQGYGGSCGWGFGEEDVDQQILFYVNFPLQGSKRWGASICSRTTRARDAKEDLLYLDNMKKFTGKTRVSGTYRSDNTFHVANKKIRIVGEKKTYEINTDDNGVFEIYDLPPGKYRFEPEIPKGWKIDLSSQLLGRSSLAELQESGKSILITLEPKRQLSFKFSLEPDNAVEGRIVDSFGNPMEDVAVHLSAPDETEPSFDYDHTDENGKFRITAIDEGSYVLVINPDGANSEDNYPRLFYPGVMQKEKATLINISAGEVIKGINLVMPKLFETVTFSGVVKYSDESAVNDARVQFDVVKTEGIAADERTFADSLGRFKFKVIEGLRGEIYAYFYASPGDYLNCPQLDALIEASGQSSAIITTAPIKIDAAQDLDNLVLRFPVPSCKRKEREPQ